MALYDNKLWLLSHIRNSFISTDDTGMSELVMVGEDLSQQLADKLDAYRDPADSEEDEDDMGHEPYDMHLDMDFEVHRQRSNTAVRLEKLDQAKKRAAKIKNIKWEQNPIPLTSDDLNSVFVKKEVRKSKGPVIKKSLLSEQLEKCVNLPQNPYIEYAKFDGSAQVGILTRKYKIFLTMLPEEHRNYPMIVSCIATAKIEELIGFILLKCSTIHGDFPLKPVSHYGLYITEEDGEVDHDFPCLDPKECVAKFGFTCLGLVEHKPSAKNVSFETSQVIIANDSFDDSINMSTIPIIDEAKQITANMQLMRVHTTAMEAPLYQSYRVYMVNKMRTKAEIHLGISGEKIEIDPLQQKNSKFTFARQKPVSHHIDSVAWCEVTDIKSSGTQFKVVYSSSFGNSAGTNQLAALQTSASFKHYDFEADHNTAEEIVQKINLILELRSSISRKEYLASRDKKQHKRKATLK